MFTSPKCSRAMMISFRKFISDSYKNATEYMILFMFPSQILLKWCNRNENRSIAVWVIGEKYHQLIREVKNFWKAKSRFIHFFNKYLLRTYYYMPDTLLGDGNTARNKMLNVFVLMELILLKGISGISYI